MASEHASGSRKAALPVELTLEHVSPVTRLLKKRRKMLEVQENLEAQKDEYQKKAELFKRREENLRKKDLELQEALVLFNKFLKENELKRRRAEFRANEEKKKRKELEEQIATKRLELEQKNRELVLKSRRLRKNEKYKTFLQQTHDKNDTDFEEVSSIISRYKTLANESNSLTETQESSTKDQEDRRETLQRFKKNQYNKTLSLNNDIANKSKVLEDETKKTALVEEKVSSEEKSELEHKQQTTQIIMSVENLLQRCRKAITGYIKHQLHKLTPKDKELLRHNKEVIKTKDTMLKLDVIGNYLSDLTEIREVVKRKMDVIAENQTQQWTRNTASGTQGR